MCVCTQISIHVCKNIVRSAHPGPLHTTRGECEPNTCGFKPACSFSCSCGGTCSTCLRLVSASSSISVMVLPEEATEACSRALETSLAAATKPHAQTATPGCCGCTRCPPCSGFSTLRLWCNTTLNCQNSSTSASEFFYDRAAGTLHTPVDIHSRRLNQFSLTQHPHPFLRCLRLFQARLRV